MWNLSFFVNPFSPSRDEIMGYAGMKSKESFYKLIRELEALDLIRYYPSKSKFERSLFCISHLEYLTDSIQLSVYGVTNHEPFSKGQQIIPFPHQNNLPLVNIVDIRTKAKLYNGRGSLVLEKTVLIKDGISSSDVPIPSTPSYDPLSDPKYASQLDNRISSPSNNNYHANNQVKQTHRTGLRPAGIPTDPNADYSKRR
jgi:hypothetical protein